ncbi:MAG: hypothetical protein WC586_11335 [Methanoregula sp.]
MDCRKPVPAILLMFILLVVFSGCTTTPAPQGITTPVSTITVNPGKTVPVATGTTSLVPATRGESIAEQLASVKSDNAIWRETYRMFLNITFTEYVHPPYTDDDAAGIYKFDCLGFVDHVLIHADPAAYKIIGKGVNASIESYADYFNKLDTLNPDSAGWIKVVRPVDLRPGDICLWLRPNTFDKGHMWIIAGEPKVNPKRPDEVLVRIFDSTGTSHSNDSRPGIQDRPGLRHPRVYDR